MFKKFWSKIKKFGHSPTLIAYYRKDYRQTFWRKTGHALWSKTIKGTTFQEELVTSK